MKKTTKKLTPRFLTFEQIMKLHQLQIDEFGGSPGLKDANLLHSALAQPQAGFGEDYFHTDIFQMSAAYLYHLVKNHSFNDGNKRIAALAAAVFLEINGYELTATEDEFEKLVVDAAQSIVGKAEISEFFKVNSKKAKV